MLIFANNATTTLQSAVAPGDLTINLTTGTGGQFPNPTGGDTFYGTLQQVAIGIEIVLVTARSGDTITVIRAQDGTSAYAFTAGPTGATFSQRVTAADLRSFLQATPPISIALGGTGQVTANAAFNALAPSQGGHSGFFLTTNGATTSWAAVPSSGVSTVGLPITGVDAYGAQISGTTITLEYATAAFPGIVSTGAQVFAGTKGFSAITASVSIIAGGGAFVTSPIYNSAPASTWDGESYEVDGGSAIGFKLNTQNTFATTGGKLVSIQNNVVEKAFVQWNGNISASTFGGTPAVTIGKDAAFGYPGLWIAVAAGSESASNYTLLTTGTGETIINAPSSYISFRIGNAEQWRMVESGGAALLFNEIAAVAGLVSSVTDGASAVAWYSDSINHLVTAGAKVFSFRNFSTEVASIDYLGVPTFKGLGLGIVHSSSGGLFSSSGLAPSDITGGTNGQILVSNGTNGVFTSTVAAQTIFTLGINLPDTFPSGVGGINTGAQPWLIPYSGSVYFGTPSGAGNIVFRPDNTTAVLTITPSGAITATGALTLSNYTTGIAHLGSAGVLTSSLIVDADVNAAAAIAVSKLAAGTNTFILTTTGGVPVWASPAVGGINQLTSDVTAGPGTGSQAATIAAGVVTLTKMANLAADSILGNNTGSPATPIALTYAQMKTALGYYTSGDNVSFGNLAASGTVTLTASGFTTASGILHAAITTGAISSSLIVNADVDPSAAVAVSKLAAGTNTFVLTTTGGVPVWAAPAAGGVTTVSVFSGSSQPNGATISLPNILFGPADNTNPGMVQSTADTWYGIKTFNSIPVSGGITGPSGTSLTFTTSVVGTGTAVGVNFNNTALFTLGDSIAVFSNQGNPKFTIGYNGQPQVAAFTSSGVLTNSASGKISSSVSLSIALGGTGQTTAVAAANALLPSQTGNVNYVLQTDGTSTLSWVAQSGGITALTGDVTASGSGSVAATIAAGAVTLAKMANLAADSILGNNTASPATPIALTYAQMKTALGYYTSGDSPTFTALTLTAFSGALSASAGVVSAGTLSIANGGTGQITAPLAINALLPSQSGVTSGWALTTNGTVAAWSAVGGGSGFSGAGTAITGLNIAATTEFVISTNIPSNSTVVQNLCAQSHQLWNGYPFWSVSSGVVALPTQAQDGTVPDLYGNENPNTTTGAMIVFPAVTGASAYSVLWQQNNFSGTTLGAATQYTASMYLRTASGTASLYIWVFKGAFGSATYYAPVLCSITTTWTRFTTTFTTGAAGAYFFALGADLEAGSGMSATTAATVWASGAQIEAGAVATNLIVNPTTLSSTAILSRGRIASETDTAAWLPPAATTTTTPWAATHNILDSWANKGVQLAWVDDSGLIGAQGMEGTGPWGNLNFTSYFLPSSNANEAGFNFYLPNNNGAGGYVHTAWWNGVTSPSKAMWLDTTGFLNFAGGGPQPSSTGTGSVGTTALVWASGAFTSVYTNALYNTSSTLQWGTAGSTSTPTIIQGGYTTGSTAVAVQIENNSTLNTPGARLLNIVNGGGATTPVAFNDINGGLFGDANAGVPFSGYNWGSLTIGSNQVDQAYSNYLGFSTLITNAAWTAQGGGVTGAAPTKAASTDTDLFGLTNASQITYAAVTGAGYSYVASPVYTTTSSTNVPGGSGYYMVSCYLRAHTGTGTVNLFLYTGAVGVPTLYLATVSCALTTTWTRYYFASPVAVLASTSYWVGIGFDLRSGGPGGNGGALVVDAQGAQFEYCGNSSFGLPSDLIGSQLTGTATRGATLVSTNTPLTGGLLVNAGTRLHSFKNYGVEQAYIDNIGGWHGGGVGVFAGAVSGITTLSGSGAVSGFTTASFSSTGTFAGTVAAPVFSGNATTLPVILRGTMTDVAMTNLIPYGNAIGGNWTLSNVVSGAMTVTANSSDVTDLYGLTGSTKLVAVTVATGAGNLSQIGDTFTGTAVAYSASVYLRTASGSGTIYIYLNTGSTWHITSCAVTTTWTRFTILNQTLTAATWGFYIGNNLTTGSGMVTQTGFTLYAQGAQVETGALATQLLLNTTAGSVTRGSISANVDTTTWLTTVGTRLQSWTNKDVEVAWIDNLGNFSCTGVVTPLGTGNPFAEYTTAAGQSIPNSAGGFTTVNFGTKVTDTNNAVTTGASWVFTCPAACAGQYQVSACVSLAAGPVGTSPFFAEACFKYNGNQFHQFSSAMNGTGAWGANFTMSGSCIITLAVGDTVAVGILQDSVTGAAVALTASAAFNRFTIKRLP